MTYNPNSPNVVGLEWFPTALVDEPVSSIAPFDAWEFTADASNSILFTEFPVTQYAQALTDQYQLDIYPADVFPSTTVTTTTIRPTSDNYNSGSVFWNGTVNSTVNIFNGVDNATQTPVPLPGPTPGTADDDFIYSPSGQAYESSFVYAPDAGIALAGKHILRVRQVAVLQPYALAGGNGGSMTARPFIGNADGRTYGPVTTVTGTPVGGHRVEYNWYAKPGEGSWITSPSDFSGARFGWQVLATNSPAHIATIEQEWVEIDDLGVDTRVATGPVLYMSGVGSERSGWAIATTPFNQILGDSYRLELRRLTTNFGGSEFALKFLWAQSGEADAANSWRRVAMTYSGDFFPLASEPVDDGGAVSAASFIFNNTAISGGIRSSSQSYGAMGDYTRTSVYTGVDLRQGFLAPGPLTDPNFEIIKFLVRATTAEERTRAGASTTAATTTLPLAALSVSVHSGLGGQPQVGSSVLVQPSELEGVAPGTWTTITRQMAIPATLVASNPYYVKFESTTPLYAPWQVQTIGVADDSKLAVPVFSSGSGTFQGETGTLRVNNNFAVDPLYDIAMTLQTVPDTPALFVSAGTFADCISFNALEWAQPSSGDGYELQRSEDETTWETIAIVTDIASLGFNDYESRRNIKTFYRVRTTRSDGAYSSWSSTVFATASLACCGYLFTSNEDPSLSVWYADITGEELVTERLENVVIQQFYSRDYQVGFHELEKRGSKFTRTLLVAGADVNDGTDPSSDAQHVFDPLFTITRPSFGHQLSYVAVHNDLGERWFATVETPSTTLQRGPDWFTAEVIVTEVTATPTTPDGNAPGGG